MKVEIKTRSGRVRKLDHRAAKRLVRTGRFEYLTTDMAEPIPTTVTLEPAPKKRGRPKKVKDADADTP